MFVLVGRVLNPEPLTSEDKVVDSITDFRGRERRGETVELRFMLSPFSICFFTKRQFDAFVHQLLSGWARRVRLY